MLSKSAHIISSELAKGVMTVQCTECDGILYDIAEEAI